MNDPTLIADLVRSGLSPELLQRVVDELMARPSGVVVVKDEAAERRRMADRERKAQAKVARGIPQNSAESDAESPSLSLLPPSQTLPPSHPHTPIREAAKPATASATPPPEVLVLKPQSYSQKRPKPPKAEKPADPRHAEFVRIFAEEYESQTGSPYAMQGGKDGQQLQALLRTLPTLAAAEWQAGIRWCWKVSANDSYASPCVRQTGSLAAFCCAWSRIVAYHATYQQPTRR